MVQSGPPYPSIHSGMITIYMNFSHESTRLRNVIQTKKPFTLMMKIITQPIMIMKTTTTTMMMMMMFLTVLELEYIHVVSYHLII